MPPNTNYRLLLAGLATQQLWCVWAKYSFTILLILQRYPDDRITESG